MGYRCANFSLPRPVCSRVRPDVRDRPTDRRQTKASLNAFALWGGGIINQKLDVARAAAAAAGPIEMWRSRNVSTVTNSRPVKFLCSQLRLMDMKLGRSRKNFHRHRQ